MGGSSPGSHTNGWRIRGPGPQLHIRPAQPWPCLSDVVPGLLPGPAVHRPRPCVAGRAADAVAPAGGRVDRRHGHLGYALHRHARVYHPGPGDHLQRAGHDPQHADRGRRGVRRAAHRGLGGEGPGPLLLGGAVIGIGVASMHYMGMWAMRMPDTMGYSTRLFVLSVIIAIVAGTAALWAALRLRGLRHTLYASLIMGVAVSGMHYTGMAAMHLRPAVGGGMAAMGGGASALSFLLPLILGIVIVTFLVTAIVTLAPTEAEIREDAALMERIAKQSERA